MYICITISVCFQFVINDIKVGKIQLQTFSRREYGLDGVPVNAGDTPTRTPYVISLQLIVSTDVIDEDIAIWTRNSACRYWLLYAGLII